MIFETFQFQPNYVKFFTIGRPILDFIKLRRLDFEEGKQNFLINAQDRFDKIKLVDDLLILAGEIWW